MCIALVGGMDRLERQYRNEADKFGIRLKVFSQSEVNMRAKIRNVERAETGGSKNA